MTRLPSSAGAAPAIDILTLQDMVTSLEPHPPRTVALEKRIRIGTGFHGKWYRSQKEHLQGWLVVQEAQARATGQDPATVDARGMWGRLKCSPLMFWLAEAGGVPSELLDEGEAAAVEAARERPTDGEPHGRMLREVLPWDRVAEALSTTSNQSAPGSGRQEALAAFARLTDRVAAYRKWREWLR